MKRFIATATLVLGMSFGLTTHASAQTTAVRATVPFDFAVGNRILPHGVYNISSDGNFLSFSSRDSKAHMYTIALRGLPSSDGSSLLVFDKIQDKYFLRKVVSRFASTSREWPMSKLEKRTQELPVTRDIYAENSSR
jgi:hypothetical protein